MQIKQITRLRVQRPRFSSKKMGAPLFDAVSADSAVKGSDPCQGLELDAPSADLQIVQIVQITRLRIQRPKISSKKRGAPFFDAVSADSAVKGSNPCQGLELDAASADLQIVQIVQIVQITRLRIQRPKISEKKNGGTFFPCSKRR